MYIYNGQFVQSNSSENTNIGFQIVNIMSTRRRDDDKVSPFLCYLLNFENYCYVYIRKHDQGVFIDNVDKY